MNALIVYDSAYGNTEKVAKVVAEKLRMTAKVKLMPISFTKISDLGHAELIVIGSPTQAGRPTAATKEFLGKIPANTLYGADVAAFDTRIDTKKSNFALRTLMRIIGFAAPKIAKSLESKGGHLAGEPAGFIVDGKEGPLHEGELNRVEAWTQAIAHG